MMRARWGGGELDSSFDERRPRPMLSRACACACA